MIVAAALMPLARLVTAEEHIFDDKGYTSTNWLLPEKAELIYGTLASVIILGLLIWKAGPLAKKAFNARTEKVQGEIDDSAAARSDAERRTRCPRGQSGGKLPRG